MRNICNKNELNTYTIVIVSKVIATNQEVIYETREKESDYKLRADSLYGVYHRVRQFGS